MVPIQNHGRDKLLKYLIPTKLKDKKIVIGNIYRPPYNLRNTLNTFMGEFNATLLENNANSQNTYLCGDYNIDLLKVNNTQFNNDYFHNILSAGYIPKVTLPTRLSESSTLIDNVFTTNLNIDLSAYPLRKSHMLPTCETRVFQKGTHV